MRFQLSQLTRDAIDQAMRLALAEIAATTRDKQTMRSAVMGAMSQYSQNNVDRLISDVLRK